MDRSEKLATPDLDARGRECGSAAPTIRAKFRVSKAVRDSVSPEIRDEPARRRRSRANRLARQLVLAHWIERAIEAGQARNYADVARALGLTQPRITQIAGLLRLSPGIQESVLLGAIDLGGRGAMRATSSVEWGEQDVTDAQVRKPSGRRKERGR
jgi:prophage antirepressor-like protein